MGCYQESDKNKKGKQNITSEPDNQITEINIKMNDKLEEIPEEKNENDIKVEDQEKKMELNNEEEKINDALNIEINKEKEEKIKILKNRYFYPERDIDSIINSEKGEENTNKNDNKPLEKQEEDEKEEIIQPSKEPKIISKDFINTITLYGHSKKVTAITKLNSGKLATGSYDNTIRIWNINDREKTSEDKIIKETGLIFTLLEFEDNKLLCGTSENLINLWDLNSSSDTYEASFVGHELWVTCLVKIDNQRFASASNDARIKVWDYITHACLIELIGYIDCILSLILLQNGKFCTGSADTTIKIWDLEKRGPIQTLTGHEKWVKCVFELDNGIIVSGSDDRTIKLWKPGENYSYYLLKTIKEHTHSVRTFCQLIENILLLEVLTVL